MTVSWQYKTAKNYLQVHSLVSGLSPETIACEISSNAKTGDIYIFFAPLTEEQIEKANFSGEVRATAVIFREDDYLPTSYLVQANNYKLVLFEDALAGLARKAQDEGKSLGYLLLSLEKVRVLENSKQLQEMEKKFGSSGLRRNAQTDPLHYFLTGC